MSFQHGSKVPGITDGGQTELHSKHICHSIMNCALHNKNSITYYILALRLMYNQKKTLQKVQKNIF